MRESTLLLCAVIACGCGDGSGPRNGGANGEPEFIIARFTRGTIANVFYCDFVITTNPNLDANELASTMRLVDEYPWWRAQVFNLYLVSMDSARELDRLIRDRGFFKWQSPPKGTWYDVEERIISARVFSGRGNVTVYRHEATPKELMNTFMNLSRDLEEYARKKGKCFVLGKPVHAGDTMPATIIDKRHVPR